MERAKKKGVRREKREFHPNIKFDDPPFCLDRVIWRKARKMRYLQLHGVILQSQGSSSPGS